MLTTSAEFVLKIKADFVRKIINFCHKQFIPANC